MEVGLYDGFPKRPSENEGAFDLKFINQSITKEFILDKTMKRKLEEMKSRIVRSLRKAADAVERMDLDQREIGVVVGTLRSAAIQLDSGHGHDLPIRVLFGSLSDRQIVAIAPIIKKNGIYMLSVFGALTQVHVDGIFKDAGMDCPPALAIFHHVYQMELNESSESSDF